jgi:ABC-type multidrug transport system permease subunit
MRTWFERVFALAVKEFREFFRSKLLILLSVASPLLMFLLFSYGFTLDVKDIPFSYMDQCRTARSRELVDRFVSSKYFNLVAERFSQDEIYEDMMYDRVRFTLVVPPDFSRKLAGYGTASIQVWVNGTMASRANVTRGYLEGMIADYNDRIISEFLRTRSTGESGSMPIDILPSARFNPTLESSNVLVPGTAGLVLLIFPAVLAAISLSRERETGMIFNFYTSPLTRFQYVAGKSLPLLVIGFLNFLILHILTIWLFAVPFRGNFAILCLVTIFLLIASNGIGFLVAAIVRSQVAALLITTVVTFLPGFLYSGLMMPVQSMGMEAKITASILPIYYYVNLTKALYLKNVGLNYIVGDILGLLAIAIVLTITTLALLRKKM